MDSASVCSDPALNKALLEAVDFIHAEGWGQPPTLFALVPAELLTGFVPDDDESPLALVVQDNLPENLTPGSPELAEYLSRISWPSEVVGTILAQEIHFREAHDLDAPARPARLFSGVLRGDFARTLLQLPQDTGAAPEDAFAADDYELRGGNIAPEVLATLADTLN